MWSWDADEVIDGDFLRQRLSAAIRLRARLLTVDETNACRLVFAESDGLPGLIVDRYADTLVVQLLTAGAEFWRETIADLLVELTGIANVYERSDVDVRKLEGLEERTGALRGAVPPDRILIHENGLSFYVDVLRGHKTGFYLDQRNNRAAVRRLAEGRETLNCFSYTGGFAVYALAGGAKNAVSIDSSADALLLGAENAAVNGLAPADCEWKAADVFQALRTYRDQARSFDLIVLDPPKFAANVSQVEKASRAYKDINLLALKLLRPGGLLFTFSCSGGVSQDLFQKIVAGAALDARVDARIIQTLTQGEDHPVALNFPEGAYLKGLVIEKG
jgi:23S rRNA (cytosine1962-C5)-methyltransferase